MELSALLTNESALEDFEVARDYPGHKLTKLSEVPKTERKFYEKDYKKLPPWIREDQFMVWYPPITQKQEDVARQRMRNGIIQKLEENFGISLKDYPSTEPVYIYKIVDLIKQRERES